jgi:hypothetical protein
MKHLISSLLLSLFLSSCSFEENESDYDIIVLDVDTFERDRNLAFKTLEFIPLETNENCLLAEVFKLIYRNNFYYVLDRKSKKVFIYSEDGKFINSIYRVGQGPGEYVDIYTFDVDEENNIYINSMSTGKLIKYLYPDYLESEEYRLNFSAGDFAIDNKNNQIWVADVRTIRGGNSEQLAIYSEGELTTKLGARNVFDDAVRPLKARYFFRFEEHLYFNPLYSPYIYELGEKHKPVAKIKSSRFVSEKDFSEDDLYGIEMAKNKKIQGFDFFYKINEQYIGSLRGDFFVFLYDIASQKGKLISMPVEGFASVITQNNDNLVGILSAGSFKQMYPKQAENVDEEDNPILVKMKF